MTLRYLLAALAVSLTPAAAFAMIAESSIPWWKHAVIYEIYTRSFADSNGDGVGDLNGITQRLDHVEKLGVSAIWLTPMFSSPQVDFGYDVSDYRSIDPQFGTMADLERLQAEAKKRGVRLILDMVFNHTSDKHKWFVESASSRTNAKADWYVWSDGLPANAPGVTAYQKRFEHEGRVPPNNWTSWLGGSAWQWVPARKQFYYHAFDKEQPDLNWRNPAVQQAMLDVLRFWLDRGVDGFRLDAISMLFEDKRLRDQPLTGGLNAFGDPNQSIVYTTNLPEVHDVTRKMRKLVDSYPGDRVLIGEVVVYSLPELTVWYGTPNSEGLHLPMNFIVGFGTRDYSPALIRRFMEGTDSELGKYPPLLVFDNHDQPRSLDRYGDGKHDIEIAKGIAAILLGSRGAALTYYGAELGMRTQAPTRKEDVRDPMGLRGWPKDKGRDGQRTPMQWTPGPHAGFSTNPKSWLPIPENHATINVETQSADPNSLLNWYRTLIHLRATVPALRDGDMVMIDRENPDVLAWRRDAAGAKAVVAINMTGRPATLALGDAGGTRFRTLAVSKTGTPITSAGGKVTLPAFTSWVAAVE